jgi:hypothetical protein
VNKNRINRWRLSMNMMDMLTHINYEPCIVHYDALQGFFSVTARASHGYMLSFPYEANKRLYDALIKRGLINAKQVGKTKINHFFLITLTEEGKEAAHYSWWHKYSKDGGWRWIDGKNYKKWDKYKRQGDEELPF